MDFWEHVYDLRGKSLIPRKWKRADLRRYLEKPQGPFQPNTITTVPSNQSLKTDGSVPGNYVNEGRSPKAWRVGEGVFQLIVDPDDDKKTQDAEFARARHLAKYLRPPSSVKIGGFIPDRRGPTTQGVPPGESGWHCTRERMVVVLDRLKTVETALETYDYLQRSLQACNVVESRSFRTAFNGYYRMRQRPAEWYGMFFSILEREKCRDTISFRTVLEEIVRRTGRLEASFGSKLVATINANLPVWDRHVLDNLGLRAPASIRDREWRMRRCVEVYSNIQTWSSQVIQQDSFGEWRQRFDGILPRFRHFTDAKKLDLFLWQSR